MGDFERRIINDMANLESVKGQGKLESDPDSFRFLQISQGPSPLVAAPTG